MMKLWVDTEAVNSAGRQVRAKVSEMTADINRKALSRGTRAVNALRSAELEVLKGERSGDVYRKYPYKSKYKASAPGEPPATRSGNLRLHWNGSVESSGASGGGMQVTAVLESGERYAGYLENGTSKMAPRPFVDKIKQKAAPEIAKIYSEPYT